MLTSFRTASTKKFTVKITYNGETPDITNDSVIINFKKTPDVSAPVELTASADTATEGANGIAHFHIKANENTLEPGVYYYEIWWILANGEDKYPLTQQNSKVRISPVIS